jgi:putative spermidine/putrescine transport system permease protein
VGRVVRLVGVASLAFVCLPTFIVLLGSLGGGSNLHFPPRSLSLSAYSDLLGDPLMRQGLYRSIQLGLMSTVIAAIPGVLAALGLFRYRVRFRTVITGVLTLGFSVPLVVSGASFLLLYTRIGAVGHLWAIAVAVAAVNFPIVLFCVSSSIANLDSNLERAAATLGAQPVETFIFVTFPAILPGVLTGLIMMFVIGMTEFLVTLINSTVDTQTLPVIMFGTLRGAVSPVLAAAGGVFIAISFAVVFLVSRLRQVENLLFHPDAGRDR